MTLTAPYSHFKLKVMPENNKIRNSWQCIIDKAWATSCLAMLTLFIYLFFILANKPLIKITFELNLKTYRKLHPNKLFLRLQKLESVGCVLIKSTAVRRCRATSQVSSSSSSVSTIIIINVILSRRLDARRRRQRCCERRLSRRRRCRRTVPDAGRPRQRLRLRCSRSAGLGPCHRSIRSRLGITSTRRSAFSSRRRSTATSTPYNAACKDRNRSTLTAPTSSVAPPYR